MNPRTLRPRVHSSTSTDAELVECLRENDMSAFDVLYRRHAPMVTAVVRKHLGDKSAVGDAVQEVFTRALEQLPKLREADRFRPWLITIAKYTAIDRGRASRRVQITDEDQLRSVPYRGTPPDELAELAELAQLLQTCVESLPHRDATALTLVTHFGFLPEDVARSLGVTRNAAKVIVHRARQRLRDVVSRELMARATAAPRCPAFARLRESGVVADLARHLRECELCAETVRTEVHLFGGPSDT